MRLLSPLEVRATAGRTLRGTVIHYGAYSPTHRERIEAGALVRDGPDTWLSLDHDTRSILCWEGAGLAFEDGPDALSLRAELPNNPLCDRALEDVRAGRKTGLSVEMRVSEDARVDGTRIVKRASLDGVGLVRHPSYTASRITEVRARSRTRVRGKFGLGSRASCRCRRGCDEVHIDERALDAAIAEAKAGKREVFAFTTGRFQSPLASVGSDTLRITRKGSTLNVELVGLPDTQAARELVEVAPDSFVAVRPYFPDDQSDVEVIDRVAYVKRADLRAIELAVISGPTVGLSQIEITEERRRIRLWL